MNDKTDSEKTSNLRTIVETGFRQVAFLESFSMSYDQRAGVLIGLLTVVIALALQARLPEVSSPLDMLFWFSGFGLLFSALVVLAASLTPRKTRRGPDIAKLHDACIERAESDTLKAIASELKQVWLANHAANETRATMFKVGLWLSISGIAILAFDILVVRLLK